MPEQDFNAPLRTLSDLNKDVFRYGIHKHEASEYEDPTFLGFTIDVDDTSALFTQVRPFLEKNAESRAELNARLAVYDQFISNILMIFKSQESVEDESQRGLYIKQHYINSISGLNLLTKKFNKWREDKLSFELHEDIALFSTYVGELYNNLVYSYENGREMIPENLLNFNMYIKISEARNLTSIKKLASSDASDKRIADALKNNVTCLVYKLYDCQFDFFNSQPHEDSITQAGIDASGTIPHSIYRFDTYFKSCTKQIFNPLIKNAIAMNNNKVDLDVIIINKTGTAANNSQGDQSGTNTGSNGEPFQSLQADTVSTYNQEAFLNQAYKKPSSLESYDAEVQAGAFKEESIDLKNQATQLKELDEYNKPLDPEVDKKNTTTTSPSSTGINGQNVTGSNDLFDPGGLQNLQNLAENSLSKQINTAKNTLQQKRDGLINSFVNDLKNEVGLKTKVLGNVYTDDLTQEILAALRRNGVTIADDAINLFNTFGL